METSIAFPERPGISLIVAAAENGVIGRENALPWRLPDDLKRFKALTWGKPILMGRRTWVSLGRPLPGRENLVLTRDVGQDALLAGQGATVVHSLTEALQRCVATDEIAVIGGAELYRASLPLADRIYLTRVHAEVEGDTFLPPLEACAWRVVASEHHPADARHVYAMTFETLERVRI